MRSNEQVDPEIDISHAKGELPSPEDIGLMDHETLVPLKKIIETELMKLQEKENNAKQARLKETLSAIEKKLGNSK